MKEFKELGPHKEMLGMEPFNLLESHIILTKQYSSYYVLSTLYVIIINIVIIILCVLDYQVYIITKASVEVTTNEIHLLVPVKLNDVKYYTNNNYLLIAEKEYPYHIYKIDPSLSIDETGENYQLLKLVVDLPEQYQINNYLVTIKIPKEKRKIINYLLEYF